MLEPASAGSTADVGQLQLLIMDQDTPGEAHDSPIAASSHVEAGNVEVARKGDAFQRLPTDVIRKCVLSNVLTAGVNLLLNISFMLPC